MFALHGVGWEGRFESWPKVNYYLCLAHVTQNSFFFWENGWIDGCGAICELIWLWQARLTHNIMQQNFGAPLVTETQLNYVYSLPLIENYGGSHSNKWKFDSYVNIIYSRNLLDSSNQKLAS